MTSGTGSEVIRVSTDEQLYIVNWHTDLSNLNPDSVYRATVSVDGKDMGFADVEVGVTGKELKSVNSDEFVPLVDGRTLPLKFRIDAGAGCVGVAGGCAEAIVDPAVLEQVIVTLGNVPIAFGEFPAGWTDEPQLVRIERIPDAAFNAGEGPLGTDFPQYPLFFDYFTTAPEPFNRSVRIGVCNVETPGSDPYHPQHRGSTVLAMGGTPEEFRTLVFAATADVLGDCEGANRDTPEIGAAPTSLGELAARLGQFGASMLAPRVLHASALVLDGGMGGETSTFTPAGTVDTASAPDLTIQSLSVSPDPPTSGAVTLDVSVGNAGGSDAAAGATVNLCAVLPQGDGFSSSCQQFTTPALAPGTSASFSGAFNLSPGNWHAYASVDTFNVVAESDETNNTQTGPTFTVPAPAPTIDGILSTGEWDAARQIAFDVSLPEGGTTPGTLYVLNDQTNLYLAVKFNRTRSDADNRLNFEFDLNSNGLGPEDGDESFTFTSETGFSDAFRSTCDLVPAGCVTTDVPHGAGAFTNNETFSFYELSHQLNSGETGKDFAITSTTTIGLLLQLRVGAVTTRYPEGIFPTYTQITITLAP